MLTGLILLCLPSALAATLTSTRQLDALHTSSRSLTPARTLTVGPPSPQVARTPAPVPVRLASTLTPTPPASPASRSPRSNATSVTVCRCPALSTLKSCDASVAGFEPAQCWDLRESQCNLLPLDFLSECPRQESAQLYYRFTLNTPSHGLLVPYADPLCSILTLTPMSVPASYDHCPTFGYRIIANPTFDASTVAAAVSSPTTPAQRAALEAVIRSVEVSPPEVAVIHTHTHLGLPASVKDSNVAVCLITWRLGTIIGSVGVDVAYITYYGTTTAAPAAAVAAATAALRNQTLREALAASMGVEVVGIDGVLLVGDVSDGGLGGWVSVVLVVAGVLLVVMCVGAALVAGVLRIRALRKAHVLDAVAVPRADLGKDMVYRDDPIKPSPAKRSKSPEGDERGGEVERERRGSTSSDDSSVFLG